MAPLEEAAMNGQQCARCDYHGDLAEHAADTSHPMCTVCNRSLPLGYDQTCTTCIGWARRSLNLVEELYPLLPHELTARAGTAMAMDLSGIRADNDPLLGGDVMVMLGPGSTRYHSDTVHADSILGQLERWEQDWRITFGDQAATAEATLSGCMVYLLRHLARAAQEHPTFDEWAEDVRQMRRGVEQALNLVPERSPVPCITCGTRSLERPAPKDYEWRCARCHRNYTQDEFYMAMRQHGKAV
jgi:hypothetical protein